jgi:hypothetical protein
MMVDSRMKTMSQFVFNTLDGGMSSSQPPSINGTDVPSLIQRPALLFSKPWLRCRCQAGQSTSTIMLTIFNME